MPGYSEIQRKANDRNVKKRSVEIFGTIFGIHVSNVQASNRDADISYVLGIGRYFNNQFIRHDLLS